MEDYKGLSQSPPFDEEDECRVCRGPAEEGYPLFSPCKCSGSIGLTHQDCLASWLKVQRLDGRCELCGTKFRFAPLYAEGAPLQLPWHEVMLGLSRSAVAKWLPWLLRIATALGLWLVAVPLATAYAYIGWLHSPSAISTRLQWDLMLSDTISGFVIAGVAIVSFLSLMSFADFLRFNFQRGGRNRDNNVMGAENPVQEDDIDDIVLDHNHIARRRRNLNAVGVMDQRQPMIADRRVQWEDELEDEDRHNMDRFLRGMPADPNEQRVVLQRRIRAAAALHRHLDGIDDGDENRAHDGLIQEGDEERIAGLFQAMEADLDDDDDQFVLPQRRNNFEPQFEPMNEPMDQAANQDDMEMNLALDELLGLRGPIGALLRNILWFMAFVMTYLGIFAFVPRFVGSTVYRRVLNSTDIPRFLHHLPLVNTTEPKRFVIGLVQILEEINFENNRLEQTLKLNDIFLLGLGYMSMALLIVAIQFAVSLRQRIDTMDDRVLERNDIEPDAARPDGNGNDQHDGDIPNNFDDVMAMNDDEIRMTLGQFLTSAIDCSAAFVKVGVLLFLKMFLLPLILGVWLDTATLTAFAQNPSARILYAGSDLFSAILLHWVVGITFMLLVTVSVLQLREVIHPGLLARVIRPQEPQPDLLGNLLNESVFTHTKRMVLSFGIYAVLLMIYVWLPAQGFQLVGADSYIPFLRPRFWYLMTPQLQVPLELLVFHLTMLGFLEKYKNGIGELQHRWLVLVCQKLGLTDYLLPRTIQNFVFVGSKAIFFQLDDLAPDMMDDNSDSTPCLTAATASATKPEGTKQPGGLPRAHHNYENIEVDPFWYNLATKTVGIERFVEDGITLCSPDTELRYEPVHVTGNGKRTVKGCKAHIRVPLPSSEQDVVDRCRRRTGRSAPAEAEEKNLISSTIGAFRLRRAVNDDGTMVIEFWKECRGNLIPRPPEGWDDLGVGGAAVQGHWAWGNERKSTIEEGVATRNVFFGPGIPFSNSVQLVSKVLILLFLSWMAIVAVSIVGLSAPLVTGRLAFRIFRLPDEYVHDLFAFGIGLSTLSIIISACSHETVINRWTLATTIRSFRDAPRQKVTVVMKALFVWVFVVPCSLGLLYEMLVIKSLDFFGSAPIHIATSMLKNWGLGFIVLHLWAYLCFKSAFTKQFWLNIGNAAFEADGEDVEMHNVDPPGETGRIASWQGSEHGRIARFFDVLCDAVILGNWDRVDPDVLLDECIIPIAQRVIVALCLPLLTCGTIAAILFFAKHQYLLWGTFPLLLQSLCTFTICIQILLDFTDVLGQWFEVAHKAARDDRYLVGEVLLNYFPGDDNQ